MLPGNVVCRRRRLGVDGGSMMDMDDGEEEHSMLAEIGGDEELGQGSRCNSSTYSSKVLPP